MKKLGIFVGEDNWTFFREIFENLDAHYQTEIFRRKTYNTPILYGRLNRWAYRKGIGDVLHRNDVCFFEWASDLLEHASKMPKIVPIITRLHSFELYDWGPKINWEAVDKVILVSQMMQKRFCELYPQQAAKTIVVYNGVDLKKYSPPIQRDFSFRLGMLSHILPIKRVYEAILTIAELRNRGHKASLHIAGAVDRDYRYSHSVLRLVEELKLTDNVTFYGNIDNSAEWLRMIDIFISNSYWEGQQVALLEALASGCYCLAHFWAGVEEILPAENIYITELQLIEKLTAYSNLPPDEKRSCQAQSRSIACNNFDEELTKTQIRRILQDLAYTG